MLGNNTGSNISTTPSCNNFVTFTSIQTFTTSYISNQTPAGLPPGRVIGYVSASKVLRRQLRVAMRDASKHSFLRFYSSVTHFHGFTQLCTYRSDSIICLELRVLRVRVSEVGQRTVQLLNTSCTGQTTEIRLNRGNCRS